MKVKIFNRIRQKWWKDNLLGYTEKEEEAGIYDFDLIYRLYGKNLISIHDNNLFKFVEFVEKDYRERFKIEYRHLNDRINKLSKFLKDWQSNKLNFEPKCSYDLLQSQLRCMLDYKSILEERSMVEDIQIEEDLFENE